MYFDYTLDPNTFFIDDRTWTDLNMDEVYSKIDRTLTSCGQHVLYDILRKPLFEKDELKKRGTLISHFQTNNKIRESLQLILSKGDTVDGGNAVYLLWEELNPIRSGLLYYILFIFALLSPGLFLISIPLGMSGIAMAFFMNMKIHYSVQKAIQGHFPSVKYIGRLVRCALDILKLDDELLKEYQETLEKNIKPVSNLPQKTGYVGSKNLDEFYQYLSIFYLIEVRTFWRVMGIIRRYEKELRIIYRELGTLDAILSIASYRESLPSYCEPEFRSPLKVKDIYHPLLDKPVSNSISLKKTGVLITGSNMSGKSTFLRTIGINVLFAQSIYTCLASSYQGGFYELLTSIGRSDNIIEGKSYYLVEAQALLRIIQNIERGVYTFCIVDEIFRGTNSTERLAASHHVLRYLARKNCLTFVATHDLELIDLLGDLYENYHFRESFSESGLEFDYLLKEGPSATKNAIRLLEFLGYPEEVIKPAEIEVKGKA